MRIRIDQMECKSFLPPNFYQEVGFGLKEIREGADISIEELFPWGLGIAVNAMLICGVSRKDLARVACDFAEGATALLPNPAFTDAVGFLKGNLHLRDIWGLIDLEEKMKRIYGKSKCEVERGIASAIEYAASVTGYVGCEVTHIIPINYVFSDVHFCNSVAMCSLWSIKAAIRASERVLWEDCAESLAAAKGAEERHKGLLLSLCAGYDARLGA